MNSVIALIPWPWRLALVSILLALLGSTAALGAWQGYGHGYDTADAKGKAALEKLQSDHAQAYAAAMQTLNERLQKETQTAISAATALAKEREANAKTQAQLRAEIASVTAGSSHTFSPAFVRLWNEAAGAASGDSHPLPAARGAPGAAGTPGAGKAPGAGLLPAEAVTEADILAYMIYYGRRAKDLEAKLNAWITLEKGWQ